MSTLRKNYGKSYFGWPYSMFHDLPRNRNRLREVLKYKEEGRLLEVGCGKGEFLKLARSYFDVEGIEISKYAASHAKRFLGDKVEVKGIEKAELNKNHYDVVAVFNLLEHLEDPPLTIKKIYNSLKPEGVLIGSVPHNLGLVGGLATKISNVVDSTHLSTFPPSLWYALFNKVGFRSIKFFGETVVGINRSKYIKSRFWKYISATLMFVCIK